MVFDAQGFGSGTISNSQCAIDGSNSSVIPHGSTSATLNLTITFSASFQGNRVIYLAARDREGGNSGWLPSAVWNVPGSTSTPAVVSSVFLTLPSYVVSVTYKDATDNMNLSPSQILINDYLDGRHACYLGYDHINNRLYLVADVGGTLLPQSIIPNSGTGSMQNSQCIVGGQGTTVTSNGTSYTLSVNLFFLPAFRGHRVIYAATQTPTGGNSGWQAINAINLP